MSQSDFVLRNAPELQEAIVRRSIRDAVASKIAALIASGVLQVGDDLPSERSLASALQVSRETVRGGIQNLVSRGLLTVVHGARTKVISSDVEIEIDGVRQPQAINEYRPEQIHASRMLVELTVVGEATSNVSEETIAFLEASLRQQRVATNEPVRFLIIDREFHLAIYRSCPNRVLGDFVADLYGYMMGHRRRAVSKEGAIQKSFDDHVAIVEGLKRRDRMAVVDAFAVHLDRIYRTTMTIMGEGKEAAPGR